MSEDVPKKYRQVRRAPVGTLANIRKASGLEDLR